MSVLRSTRILFFQIVTRVAPETNCYELATLQLQLSRDPFSLGAISVVASTSAVPAVITYGELPDYLVKDKDKTADNELVVSDDKADLVSIDLTDAQPKG